ncbi:MAG: phosphomannomutase [Calditrichae bacterium]|nr:phosphomannomutase [Calditrichia bacterium]
MSSNSQLLQSIWNTLAHIADFDDKLKNTIKDKWIDVRSSDLWELANILGNYYNSHQLSADSIEKMRSIITNIREEQGKKAMTNPDTTTVVFGTSGWRGVIGQDFTLLNVHKVLRAIVDLLKDKEFLSYNNFSSFQDVQKSGILILRDNRFMGDVFLAAARKELTAAGIKVLDAGECPTGVGSALLTELKAAGSINFTPSHNPMEYAGIKFNPSDGGPADQNLTSIIEKHANAYMQDGVSFEMPQKENSELIQKVDGKIIFRDFVEQKAKAFDIAKIRQWLNQNASDITLIIDFMHGSSRGYIEMLIGDETINTLKQKNALHLLHVDDDYSFHGVKPEPSAKNQAPLIEMLRQNKRRFTLAVALDPDADRIRYADDSIDIDMNRFAAIAYNNLLDKGITGGVVSSVPSSDFVLKIAEARGQKVVETAVGFKNFRDAFKSGEVVMGFEESDGISFIGHTLEKCALAGFLAALDALATKDQNLSRQYLDIQQKYGFFYPDKAGADVKGVSVEAWQAYKKSVVKTLQTQLFKAGDTLTIGNETRKVKSINTIDGLKINLDDDSWILLRPSGTEPKFRYYYEVVSKEGPLDDAHSKRALDAYNQAAATILQKARDLVDDK